MAQIILDMGSGNTCKNSVPYIQRMIDAVAQIDTHKHEVIFKWQLFKDEPPNVPLDGSAFTSAYFYAKNLGYKTTSSVFDQASLEFLLQFEIPFVKIACRPRLYWLIGEVPRRVPVKVSYYHGHEEPWICERFSTSKFDSELVCVPKYPAPIEEYPIGCPWISDHVEGLALWYRNNPSCWEKHFILEDDPSNPDAAGHAIKPEQLKEIL